MKLAGDVESPRLSIDEADALYEDL